jgi:acetolactate synthase small subunit
MVAGTPEAVDDFESLMRPYGIAGLQRTGRIALPKLDEKLSASGALAPAADIA